MLCCFVAHARSSSGENTDLSFPAPGTALVPRFSVEATGGAVGSFLRVDGSNATINVSATSSADLPAPAAGAPGLTVELLLLLPSDGFFNLAGEQAHDLPVAPSLGSRDKICVSGVVLHGWPDYRIYYHMNSHASSVKRSFASSCNVLTCCACMPSMCAR